MHPLRVALAYAAFPTVLGVSLWAGVAAAERGELYRWLPAIVPCAAIVIAGLERVIPFERAWWRSRGDVRTDILHLLVSNLGAPELYKAAVILALAPVTAALYDGGAGPWPRAWSLWAQLALALVVGELGQYWAHRLAHEREALWRLHAVHHSPGRLYWLNAGRDHPLGVLLLFVPEVAPLVALGAPEEVLVLFALFTAVHGLFQHCNIDVRLGPLNWIFSMAELHRWHHSTDTAEANHNFGANLIVWDVVFGTRYLPRGRRPPTRVGIGDMPGFPPSYLAQLAVPFRWRAVREASRDRATHASDTR